VDNPISERNRGSAGQSTSHSTKGKGIDPLIPSRSARKMGMVWRSRTSEIRDESLLAPAWCLRGIALTEPGVHQAVSHVGHAQHGAIGRSGPPPIANVSYIPNEERIT
jgi:hypothetical protein